MPNKALCLITALFIFDFMIRAENLHVRTCIHNFIFINLLYSNFSPSLRLDSTDHIRPHCQTHAAINKTDDMTDA